MFASGRYFCTRNESGIGRAARADPVSQESNRQMSTHTAEFILSATAPEHFPNTPFPEIAFAGRSNVGKSSLLNKLIRRKNLAHTSSTPGKTRQINFYRVDDRFQFVDLPGYGYAKVSKQERESWRRLIESYLLDREQLRLVVSLIDIRHEPTALDRDLLSWLESIGRRYAVVLTKADKVKGGMVERRVRELRELVADHECFTEVFPYSTEWNDQRIDLIPALTSIAVQK